MLHNWKSQEGQKAAFLALGRALGEWANIEMALGMWFDKAFRCECLSGESSVRSHHRPSRDLFFSQNGFESRAKLLKNSLRSDNFTSDDREFLDHALKLANSYNSLRTTLAHGQFWREGKEGSVSLVNLNDTNGINLFHNSKNEDKIHNAAYHFEALFRILLYTVTTNGIESIEGLRRIKILPKDPCITINEPLLSEIYERTSKPLSATFVV